MTAVVTETPQTTTDVTRPARERERTAARLIKSSAKHSFDPEIEVDWANWKPEPGLYYCPLDQANLLGTSLWEEMTLEQRIESTKHQVMSIAAVGVWFELILMQMLIRRAYDQSPTTDHMRYGLIEIADECRHSIMFGRMIETTGCPDYGPRPLAKALGRFFKTIADGPVTYAGALIAEEILDSFQRDAVPDENVQPLVRTVSRIHVVEEARHVSYAKEELERIWPTLPWYRKAIDRVLIAGAAVVITRELLNPEIYDHLGADAKRARKEAKNNPQWKAAKVHAARKLVSFFNELGIINGAVRWRWKLAGLLG